VHRLRDDGPVWTPTRRLVCAAVSGRLDLDGSIERLAERCRQAARPEALTRLADGLGLSAESLRRLGVGWFNRYGGCWSFPMRSASGQAVGIRLRRPDGRKLTARGGHDGLFLPEGLADGGRLLVTEGPTDCAALLDLGFHAVGRPSCTGGIKLLVELVGQQRPAELVVVADGDGPGQRGAEALAAVLVAYAAAVRVIAPPVGIKDAREWRRRGATAVDVLAAIDAAPARRLAVKTSILYRKAGAKYGR
jgi:hypothetical protein